MDQKKLVCHYCHVKFPVAELEQVTKTKRSCFGCIETKKRESEQYKQLIDYICTGFKQKAPSGRQLQDIKKFKTMGYSYLDIQWTLYYIVCIVGKKLDGNLGLIPFYYKQAKEHFEAIDRAKKSAEGVEVEVKNITINSNNNTQRSSKKDKTRYINIEEII